MYVACKVIETLVEVKIGYLIRLLRSALHPLGRSDKQSDIVVKTREREQESAEQSSRLGFQLLLDSRHLSGSEIFHAV